MRILALEPYYGGSHKAFLDGWRAHSRHDWTILGLPAYKWKWRMRHAALTFAEQVRERAAKGESWDLLFCSDMLDLATFLGLAPPGLRALPSVVYFHENQLTYPLPSESDRDYTYAFINLSTAHAASRVWFNSDYHRGEFLVAFEKLLKRMPDFQPGHALEAIPAKSEIQPQGIEPFPPRSDRAPGPMRLLWAARWEFDKAPETFFEALGLLKARGVEFRVSVIGEQFRQSPAVFTQARERFGGEIDRWGFQKTREEYVSALREADVVVSTAIHEFFGISLVEAVAAGAFPLVPERLSYPEILSVAEEPDFFYGGGAGVLADRLVDFAGRIAAGDLWWGDSTRGVRRVERFLWPSLARRLDDALMPPDERR